MSQKISTNEYAPFFQPYISALSDNEMGITENLEFSHEKALELLANIPPEKETYQYEKGKWTIKEIIQHIIDSERVFNYRSLRISRRDGLELLGFDENHFTKHSNANERDYGILLNEFSALRKTTVFLYSSLSAATLMEMGIVSGNRISVRALGYLTSGHLLHHLNVINKRYL